MVAEALTVLAALPWAVGYGFRRLLRLRRAWENVLAVPLLLGLASATLATGAISSRHFGEWRELNALLAQHSDVVSREVRDGGRPSTRDEYEALRRRITPEPKFVSRGFREPLTIRVMRGAPPYVGVDFGQGRNAIFDLTTMICIYSD